MRTIATRLLKPWIIMPLVAVLAVGGWWIFFRPDDSDAAASSNDAAQVVTATQGPMARTVSADGTIAAARTDDLSFSSAGTVTAVNVKAGQAVKAGQVLATVDSAELQSAVADAESSVADAQAKLDDDTDSGASDAQLAADTSALASAQDKSTSAQSDLAGAQLVATFDGTVAAVNVSVGEQLTSGGSGGTGQTGSGSGSGNQASTLGSGNSNPLVGGGNGNNGDSSSSSAPDIQVVSTSSFTIDLGFDDTDIADIKVGQSSSVSLSTAALNNGRGNLAGGFQALVESGALPQFAGGNGGNGNGGNGNNGNGNAQNGAGATTQSSTGSATGKVTSVGTIADASSGVAEYPVTVAFTDTSGTYHTGANATVEISYSEVPDAVQVPSLAVTTDNGTSTVIVHANGHDEKRTVTTGLTANGMVQITNGLRAGEQVVLQIPTIGARNGNGGNGGTGGNAPPGGNGEFPRFNFGNGG